MLDLAPTIEDICGLEPDGARHGLSLMPLIRGEKQPTRDDFAVSSSNGQQFGFYCNRSIRTEKYRYIWNLTDVDELYDITNDPGELRNIANTPGVENTLRELRLKLYEKLVFYNDPFACGWVAKQLTEGRKA
jgi:arylsulfatase A-like enzyme